MNIKKLFLILSLGISTFASAMQEKPKIDEWPSELPETWEFSRKIPKEYDVKEIIGEIEHAYPKARIFSKGKHIEVDIEDSKENIIKNFNGKGWFSEKKLARPLFIDPARKE